MTASQIIDGLAPILVGTKYGDTSDSNIRAILLSYLNMAKNEIAIDALCWLGGEQILMIDGVFEYTLSKVPIQITDVFDDTDATKLQRNSSDANGYYQLSPDVLYFNTPVDSTVISINYYYTPSDYLESSEVKVPSMLINAIQYFIAHKALESYKDGVNSSASQMYLQRYQAAINKFISFTDNANLDTVDEIDRIWQRNLV